MTSCYLLSSVGLNFFIAFCCYLYYICHRMAAHMRSIPLVVSAEAKNFGIGWGVWLR